MQLLAFGIAKEIFETPVLEVNLKEGISVAELRAYLASNYPQLQRLSSYMIAVNNEYATDNQLISINDEIAIIPPVSGG
jgi:molybdopterin synthase sulfur carrier subunit